MAGKQYRIDVVLGISDAEAKTKRAAAGLSDVEKAAKKAADEAEKTVKASAKAAKDEERLEEQKLKAKQATWDKWSKYSYDMDVKEQQRKEKAAQQATAATQKQIDKDLAAKQKAADRAVAIAEKEAQQAAQAAINYAYKQSQEQQKLVDKDAAYRARVVKQHLTEEQLAFQVRNRVIQNSNQKRIQDAVQLHEQEGKGLLQNLKGWQQIAGTVFGIGLSIQGLISLTRAWGDANREATERSKAFATTFGDDRDKLRELASIQGVTPDNKFALDVAKFGVSTGLNKTENLAFQESFYNTAQQYKDKLAPGEFEQYKELVGRVAAKTGIAPKVIGELAGRVLSYHDYTKEGKAGAETAAARLNVGAAILSAGSGDNSVLAQQTSMLMAANLDEDEFRGTFTDIEQVTTAISTAAEKDQAQADTLVRNTVKGLRDFAGKPKGLLAKAGITKKDRNLFDMIRKLGPAVDVEMKRTGGTLQDVLRENFEDERERQGIAVFLNKGLGPTGTFAQRAGIAAQNQGFPALDTQLEQYEKSQVGLRRQRQAGVELAQAERGAANSRLDIARLEAIDQMTRERTLDTTKSIFLRKAMDMGTFGTASEFFAEQTMVDRRVRMNLNARTPDATVGDMDVFPLEIGAREAEFNRMFDKMEAAGFSPLTDAIKKLNTNMEDWLAEQKRQRGGGNAPPPVPHANPAPAGPRRGP